MNEKLLEKKLREEIKKLGGMALKFTSPFYTGMPDRIVLMPGAKTRFVELKSLGKKPKERQQVVFAELQNLDFEVWVIDSREKLESFLKIIAQ